MSEQKVVKESRIGDVELAVSKLLRIGVVLSALVIIMGMLKLSITGDSGYVDNIYPTTITGVIEGLLALKSYAIIQTGLLLLILTPVFRVAVSILVFLKEKDYLYVGITSLVFVILIISFIIGKFE